jgi:hypothetical protein
MLNFPNEDLEKRMKRTLMAVMLAALASGCATQTFQVGAGSSSEVPTSEVTQHFFVSGLGQTKSMDAAAVCGGADKVVKVEAHLNFLNGLLGGLTSGIYTPRTARVYCAQ